MAALFPFIHSSVCRMTAYHVVWQTWPGGGKVGGGGGGGRPPYEEYNTYDSETFTGTLLIFLFEWKVAIKQAISAGPNHSPLYSLQSRTSFLFNYAVFSSSVPTFTVSAKFVYVIFWEGEVLIRLCLRLQCRLVWEGNGFSLNFGGGFIQPSSPLYSYIHPQYCL